MGQFIQNMLTRWGIVTEANTWICICYFNIYRSIFLTGIGVYDKIGDYAGAGSVVPITGFANSIVSPAMGNLKRRFCIWSCLQKCSQLPDQYWYMV